MPASTYEVFDERFNACFRKDAKVEMLWTGARWCEGPANFPGRTLPDLVGHSE